VTEPDSPEDVPLPKGLRPSTARLALVVWALVLCSVVGLCLLSSRPSSDALGYGGVSRLRSEPPKSPEEETPAWANETDRDQLQSGRGARRRFRIDEDGAMGAAAPAAPVAATAARAALKEQAANMGIIGNLAMSRATNVPMRLGTQGNQDDSDPASPLGALMGDAIGANFGFGGLGSRGAGRVGLGAIGTIGHGAGGGGTDAAEARSAASDAEPLEPALLQALAALRKRDAARPAAPATPAAQLLAQAQRGVEPGTAQSVGGPADAFFAHYTELAGVTTQPAHGYWQNSYVPGDASLRMLQARLASYDRAALLPESAHDAPLDTGVSRNPRPFDPPSHGALTAFVSASERGASGARRMLVQVGLQATPRFSGQRPALNLAIVLDLRDAGDAQVSGPLRALLAAFVSARDGADRFRLYATGPGGGLVVEPEAFRSGPVTVALQRLLSSRDGAEVDLNEAVDQALAELQRADDPSAPLGSSGLVLISASALGEELAGLEARLHRGAVAGVPASVFGVGARIGTRALTRLALAGQGNQRLIASSEDAARAVDQELSAVARVVARAVRLRMRLAPGVQLVGVLGSKRLDELHAEQVRQAEQHIDQRVAQALGIAADRGDDDEGIQVIIPSFYAGDSHLILLDVVVPGAGPVLELSVRYKDLIELDNAVLRESLALSNQELARGPLQQQVLESLLAHELADQLDLAGRRVGAGDSAGAARLLGALGALLDDARRALPGLVADRQFGADRRLVHDYLRLLPALGAPQQREFLSDSLRFAALMKSQPRPRWDGTGVEP
jgi:hypothetical protein